eukprot:6105407-Amphidinium_carterae.2
MNSYPRFVHPRPRLQHLATLVDLARSSMHLAHWIVSTAASHAALSSPVPSGQSELPHLIP